MCEMCGYCGQLYFDGIQWLCDDCLHEVLNNGIEDENYL